MEESSYPSVPEQVENLAQFSFNVIRDAINSDRSPFASPEIQNQRLRICQSCEYYNARQIRCKRCGCFLRAKVKFIIDSCPLSKWGDAKVNGTDVSNINQVVNEIKTVPTNNQSKLTFPSNPSLGDIHESDKGVWQYDGRIWKLVN